MQEMIILAGPNGAGKSSFADQFLREVEGIVYVNADELARRFVDQHQDTRDIAAARLMLEQLNALVLARRDVMFETTLSSLGYARKIPAWRRVGYYVSLVFLRLPSAEMSIKRVATRVADGGHNIPEQVIRRRFARSAACLSVYKNLVDEWYVYDSLHGDFIMAESSDGSKG